MLVRELETVASLTEAERHALEVLPMRIHALDARQDIVRAGDPATQCCLILSGWACRQKLLSTGKRQIFSFHIAGDVPDLQSLHVPILDHSIATMTTAVVGFIPHTKLRTLAVDFPNLGALLWRDTLIDAGNFRAWMVGMGRRSAYEGVAHRFCELDLKIQAMGLAGDLRCPLPVTQTDLADALGLTPVPINRVLREMRASTLLTLRSTTLVIETGDELLRLSEFDPTYLRLEKRATG